MVSRFCVPLMRTATPSTGAPLWSAMLPVTSPSATVTLGPVATTNGESVGVFAQTILFWKFATVVWSTKIPPSLCNNLRLANAA